MSMYLDRLRADGSMWEDGFKYYCPAMGEFHNDDPDDCCVIRPSINESINESIRVEWNGAGLAPIGCVCEINPFGYWFEVKILAYAKKLFVYEICEGQVDKDGDEISGEHSHWIDKTKFRPVKTPEEKDLEELVAMVSQRGSFSDADIAGSILSAGFSKRGKS